MPPPVQFANRRIEAELDKRRGGLSRGAVAARDLERYYTLLDTALAQVPLASAERAYLAAVLRGEEWRPHTALLLPLRVEQAVMDSVPPGVDGPALVAKLRILSLLQCMALVDAAEREATP